MPCPCQLCPAPNATVHLTELSATGERTELHLCQACVARLELSLDAPPPIAVLRTKTSDAAPTAGDGSDSEPNTVVVPAPEEGTCPACGLAFNAYVQNNLFGCAECYSAFAEQVLALATRYHGQAVHTGRVPLAGPAPSQAARREAARAALQAALAEAVANEQFERAATLRDQLKAHENDAGAPA
jgi:protein arginine kinase activator